MDKRNLHAGHRERLREKFLNHPDSFTDHELLELLLCDYLPRVNTNLIAHELLITCGSLDGVFNASKDDLLSVKGLGEKSANGIMLLGQIYRKVFAERKKEKPGVWISISVYGSEIRKYYDNLCNEKAMAFFLDENYVPFFYTDFTDKSQAHVSVNIPLLAKLIAIKKPEHIIVAHNHPSNNPNPSEADDDTALKIATLCTVHGCGLGDNIILTKDNIFSYKNTNRISKLMLQSQYNNLVSIETEKGE